MVDKKSNQVIYCTVEEKEYLKKELEKYRLRKKAYELGLSVSESNNILTSTISTSTSELSKPALKTEEESKPKVKINPFLKKKR